MTALMRPFKYGLFAAAALAGLAAAAPALALSQAGTLTCDVSAGVGLVVGSLTPISCVFKPDRGAPQHYTGKLSKVGLDLGATAPSQIRWAVFTTAPMRVKSLAGTFAGPGAGLNIGPGLGANSLVGGTDSSISLSPLSLVAAQGFAISAGIGSITLEPAMMPGPAHHRMHHHMHHHTHG